MLAALLLAGIVAAPLGSAGLFAGARPHAHVTGPWQAARRLVLALIGTAVLAAAAAVVLRLLHATEHNLIAGRSRSRNEHDGAIFAGTMGLIRRVALEQLGGWDEWCITEDAEALAAAAPGPAGMGCTWTRPGAAASCL